MTLSGVVLLLGLGGFAGFCSGLLGIGGGILMVPLLLYVPPLLGQPALDMKTVAGITMVQSLAASLTGTLAHGWRRVQPHLVAVMGGAMAAGALVGAVASYWVSGAALQVLFAALALAAAVLLWFPVRERSADPPARLSFHRPAAVALGLAIGLAGGLVGQGGGFLIVPALIYLLRIPTRGALGSSLAIGLVSGLAGFAGKAMTAQIPLWPATVVVAGALAGAVGGSRLSQRLSQATLRRALAVVVLATALRMGWELLSPAQAPVAAGPPAARNTVEERMVTE